MLVGGDLVGHPVELVQYIVKGRGKTGNLVRFERRDKRLVKALVNMTGRLIPEVLESGALCGIFPFLREARG